jgi:hypothetical protein
MQSLLSEAEADAGEVTPADLFHLGRAALVAKERGIFRVGQVVEIGKQADVRRDVIADRDIDIGVAAAELVAGGGAAGADRQRFQIVAAPLIAGADRKPVFLVIERRVDDGVRGPGKADIASLIGIETALDQRQIALEAEAVERRGQEGELLPLKLEVSR